MIKIGILQKWMRYDNVMQEMYALKNNTFQSCINCV